MGYLFAPLPLPRGALCLWRFSARNWCSWRDRGWCCRCRDRRRCGRCMNRRPRHNHARRLRARGAASKRQQRDVARPLDSHTQPALVARANPGHPARQNLAAFLDELRQDIRALVVDEVHLLDAELADFLLAEILALAARTAAGTARTTAARSAFAPRTTMPASGSMAATAFAARRSTVRLCLFRFLCHTILPFSDLRNSILAGCCFGRRSGSGSGSRNRRRCAAA